MNLEELERLAKEATPGNWEASPWPFNSSMGRVISDNEKTVCQTHSRINADYIAAANPKVILEMIEEIKEMRHIIFRYAINNTKCYSCGFPMAARDDLDEYHQCIECNAKYALFMDNKIRIIS